MNDDSSQNKKIESFNQKSRGGRKPGTKNKDKFELDQICRKYKVQPFEGLMKVINNDWAGLGYDNECFHIEKPDGSVKMGYVISPQMRLDAMKEAAKYLYPQKRSIEMSGSLEVNNEEREREVEQLKVLHQQGILAIVGSKNGTES